MWIQSLSLIPTRGGYMQNLSRCKEKVGGNLGRRRTYHCSECNADIQVDTLHPLPKIDRVCSECSLSTGVYIFVNNRSGKEQQIRAHNAELATLRAWKISPNLTFKVPQHQIMDSSLS